MTHQIALILHMGRRILRRFASAVFVAVLAAAVVVPYPTVANCAQAVGSECCCFGRCGTGCRSTGHRNAASHSARDLRNNCCPLAAFGNCVDRTCDCRQIPEPQNTSSESTKIQNPTGPVALLPAAATFHGGIEFASYDEVASDGHFAAIPHRILHCSWLI